MTSPVRFSDFYATLEIARDQMTRLKGDDNFPGLSVYDRTYALPDDGYGWPCTAIVRACTLHKSMAERGMVPVEVHTWRRNGHVEDLKFGEMTPAQLESVAAIKRQVVSWVLGEIDRLPPSTDRHWRRDGEL